MATVGTTYSMTEVAAMASATGFSVFEIENFWTDELLAATMADFRAGLITSPIVDPSQAAATNVSTLDVFLTGVTDDVSAAVSSVGGAALDIGKGTLSAIGNIGALLPLLPFIALGVGVFIITRR